MAGSGGKGSVTIKKRDIGIQVDLAKSKESRSWCCVSVWGFGVLVAVLAVIVSLFPVYNHLSWMVKPRGFHVPGELMEDLGMDGVILFKQHDRDDDGFLSLEEFEPLAHRIQEINETFDYDTPIEEWDEVLTVESFFEPLQLHTMSKDMNSGLMPGSLDSLRGLKTWKKAVKEWQNFGASHLKPFLPTDAHVRESVGQVYPLIQMPGHESGVKGATLSSNRYLPQKLIKDADIMIHRLLNMFHPKPFVFSRFAPQGSVAIIRAANSKYVDIMFRIHGEFQLNDAPFYPYWFTPGQFTGHVIMSKDGTKVLSFHLYVPTDKRLNVDMEWLNGGHEQENMEVDIGFMPRMELKSTRSSVHLLHEADRTHKRLSGDPTDSTNRNLQWEDEISEAEAMRRLEVAMYPFKQVEYFNFTDVFSKASAVHKPIHSILLWGALDDQSC